MQEYGPDFFAVRAAAAKLPYTEATIAETLRIVVGAPRYGSNMNALSRRVSQTDLPCGGYRIPAGERVLFVLPYLVNSETTFQLSDGTFDMEFRPERFIKARPCLQYSCAKPT